MSIDPDVLTAGKFTLDAALVVAVGALWKKLGDSETRHQTEETVLRQERNVLSDRLMTLLEKLVDRARPKGDGP